MLNLTEESASISKKLSQAKLNYEYSQQKIYEQQTLPSEFKDVKGWKEQKNNDQTVANLIIPIKTMWNSLGPTVELGVIADEDHHHHLIYISFFLQAIQGSIYANSFLYSICTTTL